MDMDGFPFAHAPAHIRRHWIRHMAMVPKGFLRYQLLRMLDKKPMSGSEIMSELQEMTNGYWKPSPGSIYPLLAWLQDKGHIKEETEQEPGIRRYALTERGKAFLQEHIKAREELDERFRHFGFGYGLLGRMGHELHSEKTKELRAAMRDLGGSVWNLHRLLRRKYSTEAVKEAKNVMEEAARKIEQITRELERESRGPSTTK